MRPGPTVAARLHRLGDVEAAFERAGEQRREQPDRPELGVPPAQRDPQVACVALEHRQQAGGERDRDGRPTRPACAGEQPVVVDPQRVDGEREPDGGEPQALEEPVRQLFARHVEPADDRDRRPGPERVRADHLDERRQERRPAARSSACRRGTASAGRRAHAARRRAAGCRSPRRRTSAPVSSAATARPASRADAGAALIVRLRSGSGTRSGRRRGDARRCAPSSSWKPDRKRLIRTWSAAKCVLIDDVVPGRPLRGDRAVHLRRDRGRQRPARHRPRTTLVVVPTNGFGYAPTTTGTLIELPVHER